VITCQQADVLAAALSVGSIDAGDQATLLQHLGGCAQCRSIAGEYMAAAGRLPMALEPVAPSPELRGRLMRAVYAEAAQARERAPQGGATSWWGRLWRAVPASRGFTLAAAATAVALIGLATWGVAGRNQPTPTTVAVALAATSAAPHAHGELTWDRSGGVAVITASGLPSPASLVAGHSVYEVWLVRANGSAVGAAYLSQGPDGTWSAALHGDMTKYAAVAATPEPPGGSPQPTGTRVVQASLIGA
jgi:anti-sigma-K factor RskA